MKNLIILALICISSACFAQVGNNQVGENKAEEVQEVGYTEAESSVDRKVQSGTGTIAASRFVKIMVYNKGEADGTIKVGAGAFEVLSPNEFYSFTTWWNPILKLWMLNDLVEYNATGTFFTVITTEK